MNTFDFFSITKQKWLTKQILFQAQGSKKPELDNWKKFLIKKKQQRNPKSD